MNPRKFPRTMQEAFGPYTDHKIYSDLDPIHPHDKIVLWGCLFAVIALVLLSFL